MAAAKQPLILFLASGASVPLGMPTTDQVTNHVLTEIRSRYPEHLRILGRQPAPLEPSPFDLLASEMDKFFTLHASHTLSGNSRRCWNYEHFIHALETISSLSNTWQAGTSLQFQNLEGVLTGGPLRNLISCFDEDFSQYAGDALYNELFQFLSLHDTAVETRFPAHWELVKDFINRLDDEFDLFVVTTNHDLIVEKALETTPDAEGFTPSTGCWEFTGFNSIPRLMHLHGSMLFGFNTPSAIEAMDDLHQVFRFDDISNAAAGWRVVPYLTTQSGHQFYSAPIITGLEKTSKILFDPYLTYLKHFQTLIDSNPRMLVVGYGFGDLYINSIFKKITKVHRDQRRIACIDYFSTWAPPESWIREKWEFFYTVSKWAEETAFQGMFTRPTPFWAPSGPGASCLRVYTEGFIQTLRTQENDLVNFLKS